MKLRKMLSILLIVSISTVVLAGCGKSEPTVSSNVDKTQKLSGTL